MRNIKKRRMLKNKLESKQKNALETSLHVDGRVIRYSIVSCKRI
jgi:hypothetical protein